MAFDFYFSIALYKENNMLTKRQWSVTEVLTRINGHTQEKINYFGERRKDFTKRTSLESERMSWYSTRSFGEGMTWEGRGQRMKTSGMFHEKIQNNQRKKAIETEIEIETHTYISMYVYKWQPTPVFLLGESQGRGSLVGCHLWGRTESDTTEAT